MAKIIQDSSDIIRELQPNNVDLQLKLSNNVKNKFEYLEKALPHEDATGTDITMNNTTEYYIRTHNSKGDSSHVTTTGKNLWENSNYYTQLTTDNYTIVNNGFRFTRGSLTSGRYIAKRITVENGKRYIFSGSSEDFNTNFYLALYRNNVYGQLIKSTYTSPLDYTSTADEDLFFTFIIGSGSGDVSVADIQVEIGTSITSYEPFTGGKPSPNPDYPQEVEVVKGYNINSQGIRAGLYAIVDGGYQASTTYVTINDLLPVGYGETITISTEKKRDSDFAFYVLEYDSSKTFSNVYTGPIWGTNATVTIKNSNTKYITVDVGGNATIENVGNIQVTKGTQALPYLPYNNIGINVASKNLFDKDNVKLGYTWNNTANSGRSVYYIEIEPNKTYTISASDWNDIFYDIVYLDHIGATTNLYESGWNDPSTTPSTTFTTTTGTNILCIHFKYTSAGNITMTQTMFDNATIQLEESSTATEYVPYHNDEYPLYLGDTELCKIDGYQDCFKKSTGKNLLDINGDYNYPSSYPIGTSFINGNVKTTNNLLSVRSAGKSLSFLKPNTKYTISANLLETTSPNSNYKAGIQILNSDSVLFGIYYTALGNKTYTFTTPSDTSNLWISFNNYGNDSYSVFSNIQLESGSTATDYEPYGIGVWYLHKEIGKVVLNGSESWNTNLYGTNSYQTTISNLAYSNSTLIYAICNYFRGISYDNRATSGNNVVFSDLNTHLLVIRNTTYASVTDLKTWLNTHNTEVYYVLQTPTNTIITDATLLRQLQDLDNAVSYEGTTYLTTLGNLPPIVDVTYFQDIKKLIAAATQS